MVRIIKVLMMIIAPASGKPSRQLWWESPASSSPCHFPLPEQYLHWYWYCYCMTQLKSHSLKFSTVSPFTYGLEHANHILSEYLFLQQNIFVFILILILPDSAQVSHNQILKCWLGQSSLGWLVVRHRYDRFSFHWWFGQCKPYIFRISITPTIHWPIGHSRSAQNPPD